MSKHWNYSKGRIGENIAKKYLLKIGYIFVAQNVRYKFGEIDIIFIEKGVLVFIEVKYRLFATYGLPEDSLSNNKINKLRTLANSYIQLNNINLPYRIDAICILKNQNYLIRHYKNIAN